MPATICAPRALSALEPPLLDAAIYHCQQAAEKTVKGWLQSQDDPFPKTRDVEELRPRGHPRRALHGPQWV